MNEHVYRQFVMDLAAQSQRPKSEPREEIIAFVHNAFAGGEPWAGEVLMRWERAGAARDYTAAHKNLNSVTYICRDGRRKRKTTSYSRPMRSPESAEIIGQQMQSWWSKDRHELVAWRNDIRRQAGQLTEVVDALSQLIEAMDRHPECATAHEAWLADGRKVGEIDLGDVRFG